MTTPPASLRLGLGFDAHRFGDPGRLVLGGIEIPFERRLAGHSDGDALLHALADALLAFVSLNMSMFFFRLFYADWYIWMYVTVSGFLYTLIAVPLGIRIGTGLRRVVID